MGSLGTIAIDAECLPHFVCNIQKHHCTFLKKSKTVLAEHVNLGWEKANQN